MSSTYRKKGCPYCDVEKGSLYPINAMEEKGCFYCKICETCHDPIIIYKYHNEPSNEEINEMTNWAMTTFQGRIPDFERIHITDHFSLELRPLARAKQITKIKVVFSCPICNRFFPSSEMIKSKEGLFVCRDCIINLPDNSLDSYITNENIGEESWKSEAKAKYEHLQQVDEDDEES